MTHNCCPEKFEEIDVVLPGVGNSRACPDSAETDPSLRPPDKNHIMDEGDV